MSTEKTRRLAAGYKEGTKSFMECFRLRAAQPLPGDTPFCPFCGAKTVDQSAQRTYCTTCGEDVPTKDQIEDLKEELAQEKKDYAEDGKLYLEREEDLEKEKAKVLALYIEIDDLEAQLNRERAEVQAAAGALETAAALLAECKAVIATILAGKVNPQSPIVATLADLHKRL